MQPISVIICSLNPRSDYLRRVLDSLQGQTLPASKWELLLVDNGSDTPLADSWDLSWHPHHRHIRETEPGLTAARLRAIKEATGDLLVFVDDDNLLAPDYLATALEIRRAYPYASVFGAGALEPEFEVEPPAERRPVLYAARIANRAPATLDEQSKGQPVHSVGSRIVRVAADRTGVRGAPLPLAHRTSPRSTGGAPLLRR